MLLKVKVKVAQLSDSSRPHVIGHGILWARISEWVTILSPGDLPNPGIELGSPALQADSLLAELPGKCKGCYCQSMILQSRCVRHTLRKERGNYLSSRDLPRPGENMSMTQGI